MTSSHLNRRHLLQLTAGLALMPNWAWAAIEADEGIDYTVLPQAVPLTVAAGHVHVLEFFRYGCPFCNRLDPMVQAWKKSLPSHVKFEYVPVSFHSLTHQQLYTTLTLMGQEQRVRADIFAAIHQHNQGLEVFKDIVEWVQAHGINAHEFERTWNSIEVKQHIQQANAWVQGYGITSVPQFGVQGRYVTSPALVGGDNARALQVVEHLIALSRA
jgi:thiol:disulfide interchange protein DsbA